MLTSRLDLVFVMVFTSQRQYDKVKPRVENIRPSAAEG